MVVENFSLHTILNELLRPSSLGLRLPHQECFSIPQGLGVIHIPLVLRHLSSSELHPLRLCSPMLLWDREAEEVAPLSEAPRHDICTVGFGTAGDWNCQWVVPVVVVPPTFLVCC